MWYELNVPGFNFSVCPISGGLFARNDWLFGKQLFYEYQNENDQQHH